MSLRKSPLHEEHLRLGGRMIPFGDWELPVQFAGIIEEHLTVRKAAGLFDVSHMGEIVCQGPGALAALNGLLTNDLGKLEDGQAQYNALLRPHGGIVDDLVVYRRSAQDWLLVVNAANKDKDLAWVQEQIGAACQVEDWSDRYAQLALQGPSSQAILATLTDLDLPAIGTYRFATGRVAGHEALVSRTGYTGEDGFELYLAPTAAVPVWQALLEAGAPHGLVPIGLGARDSLRLEMKFALYGNDIDETTHPLEAGLGWIVKLKKGDFVGRDALLQVQQEGLKRRLVGLEVTGRGIARHGAAVHAHGRQVGTVTSGTHAPSLGKPIAMAYVEEGLHLVGTPLGIDVRGRLIDAIVVPTPFYKRPER